MKFRILSFIFYILCVAAPVGVLIFSFGTITSVTKLSDNTTILNGENPNIADPCSDDIALSTHRPLRFLMNDKTEAFSCAWPVLNSVLRLVVCFAGIALVCVGFFFSFLRRGPIFYIFGIVIALVGAGFGYIGFNDCKTVAYSNSWCHEDMKGVSWTHPIQSIKCVYTPQIFVCVLDFASALVCVLLSFFSMCFVCKAGPQKKTKKGSLLGDDNSHDEEDPDNPFEKESLTGKSKQDTFGEPPEEEPQPKRSGFARFFGFGGNKNKQKVPEPSETESSTVNFEQESASRFAPMSKTDREAKDLPLGKSGGSSAAGQNVGNALFNFDAVNNNDDKGSSSGSSQEPQRQPEPEPPKRQPQPQPDLKPNNGVIDFEALANGDNSDPFA